LLLLYFAVYYIIIIFYPRQSLFSAHTHTTHNILNFGQVDLDLATLNEGNISIIPSTWTHYRPTV